MTLFLIWEFSPGLEQGGDSHIENIQKCVLTSVLSPGKLGAVFCVCWSVRGGDSSEMIYSRRAHALTIFLPVPLSV